MKKQLLASTALVAAGLLSAADQAVAQTPFQGPGSPPATTMNIPPTAPPGAGAPRFSIQISGFSTAYLTGTWQNDVGPTAVNAAVVTTVGAANTAQLNNASPVNIDSFLETRIRFVGTINLDNGIQPGFVAEWQIENAVFSTRRSYVYLLSQRFGQLRLGNVETAMSSLMLREPSTHRAYQATYLGSAAMQSAVLNPTGSGGMMLGPDALPYGDRANQFAYFTPRIEGFSLGASFAPEMTQSRNSQNQLPMTNGTQAVYRNTWTVAADFQRTFDFVPGGLSVALMGAYMKTHAPEQAGQGTTIGSITGVGAFPATGAGAPDPYYWYVGGRLGYAGFSLGGAYGRAANGRVATLGQLSATTSIAAATPLFANTVVSDGYAWSVGATYNFGPFGVGVGYQDGRNSDCSTTGLNLGACGARDRWSMIAATGSYQLGPGVFWELVVHHSRLTGNQFNNGVWVGPLGTANIGTNAVTPLAAQSAANAAQGTIQSNRATGFWTGLAIAF